jgi:hypothetical protein
MVCMLASRTCNGGSDALRYGTRSPRFGPPRMRRKPRLIVRRLGYLLDGRLGVGLGDRLDGSVDFFIGI